MYESPFAPQSGQSNRRFVVPVDVPEAKAEALAQAAEEHRRVEVVSTYTPARDKYDRPSLTYELWVDGIKVGGGCANTLHLKKEADLPARGEGSPEPEVVEGIRRWVAANLTVTCIAFWAEPPRDRMFGWEPTRRGFLIVETAGKACQRFYPGLFTKKGHPVYNDGRFFGHANKEGGATQAVQKSGCYYRPVPDHGWKLTMVPGLGRMWQPRSADDVAHRIREVRRQAWALLDDVQALHRLALDDEPGMARDLAELLVQIGGAGEGVARLAGVPVPRPKKETT